MKKIFLLLALLLNVMGVQAQDANFWVYLAIGQENMVGKALITQRDSVVSDNFFYLSTLNDIDGRRIGQWRKALPPIVRANAGIGLLDSFGKTLMENTKGKRIGIVSVAIDGCPITAFDKTEYKAYVESVKDENVKTQIQQYGNNPYQRLVDMGKVAQKQGVIKGILLQQGETDANSVQWLGKVRKIYYDLVTDLKLDSTKVPLIVGEVGRTEYEGKYAKANETINKIHSKLQYAFVVPAANCPLSADKHHFSYEGYATLGRKFAIKTLQGMGFELPEVRKSEPVVTKRVTVPVANVKVQISDKGMLYATGDQPIKRVVVNDSEGKLLKDFNIEEPSAKFEINLNAFPQGVITMIFYTTEGEQLFTINN